MPGKIERGRDSYDTDRNRPGQRPPPRLINPYNDARHCREYSKKKKAAIFRPPASQSQSPRDLRGSQVLRDSSAVPDGIVELLLGLIGIFL